MSASSRGPNGNPWLIFRKPIKGRVVDCLREYGTGALRRPTTMRPFGDVIRSAPASATSGGWRTIRVSSPRISCGRLSALLSLLARG